MLKKATLFYSIRGILKGPQKSPGYAIIKKIKLGLMTHAFPLTFQIGVKEKPDKRILKDGIIFLDC